MMNIVEKSKQWDLEINPSPARGDFRDCEGSIRNMPLSDPDRGPPRATPKMCSL